VHSVLSELAHWVLQAWRMFSATEQSISVANRSK
jgi:hypothetical protein